MSVAYRAVQWNRHKVVYDLLVWSAIALYVVVFVGVGSAVHRGDEAYSAPILLMRALGTCAIVLLHIVLCIGPLARLSPRFAPLLYNRRHLGVSMFLVAAAHGALAVAFYGAFGVQPAPVAVLAPPGGIPYEAMGFAALAILFVMAATSHDFWLKNLSPRVWKTLHLFVVAAYGLGMMHIAWGAMRSESSPVFPALLILGGAIVGGLHVFAGWREVLRDLRGARAIDGWFDAGDAEALSEGRARVVHVRRGERIALYRHKGALCAMSNVCAHQGGPLGEGRVIEGCATCPWHGYQYLPLCGLSPPPFTEKIETHRVRIRDGRVQIEAAAQPPGTPMTGARIEGDTSEPDP